MTASHDWFFWMTVDAPPQGAADARFGGKADSLIAMARAGFAVPSFGVITKLAFEAFLRENDLEPQWKALLSGTASEGTAELLRAAITSGRLPDALDRVLADVAARDGWFAVRSSGDLEDAADASSAGLYKTCLHVRGLEPMRAAVKACWSSMFEPRVLVYIRERELSLSKLAMSVVVQDMIDGEKSGVSFSVDPVSGRDTHVVTEAVLGLGEGLVSGVITPDRYVWDWYRGESVARRAKPILKDSELASIVLLTLDVQTHYGYPVDIEWTIAEGRVWLLQARPITAIQHAAAGDQWTTADFRDGGVSSDVCTPFMWSLYDYVWEQAMPAYIARIKLPLESANPPNKWGDMFFGRPYWNVGAVKRCLAMVPSYIEREFDRDLGIAPTYTGDGVRSRFSLVTLLRGLRVLSAMKRSFREQLSFCESFAPAQRERLAALDRIDPSTQCDDALADAFARVVTEGYYESEGAYFTLIYDNSNAVSMFRQLASKYVSSADFGVLVSGLENVAHVRHSQDLWEAADGLRREGHAPAWLETPLDDLEAMYRSGAADYGMDWVRLHIARFKHHATRELDLREPRFNEAPRFVLESIRQHLASPVKSPAELAIAQRERLEAARAALLARVPWHRRDAVLRELEQVRTFLWWREELRDLSTQYYFHIRRFAMELGLRWTKRGWLDSPDAIFFLTREEVLGALTGDDAVHARARLRAVAERNQRYYRSFRNFSNPNEITPLPTRPITRDGVAKNERAGVGGSPGIVEGRARVVRHVEDAGCLRQGDILITHFTDPGWTLKFSLLAGVVTENGGMLSHAAVISREYGIPAVLGVVGAVSSIPDGARIVVDGGRGVVSVLQE